MAMGEQQTGNEFVGARGVAGGSIVRGVEFQLCFMLGGRPFRRIGTKQVRAPPALHDWSGIFGRGQARSGGESDDAVGEVAEAHVNA